MLEESLSKIKMGDKMKDFMAASGQVISNMLEARLANQQVQQQQQQPLSSPSQSSSSLSVRSNSSSNLSRSPLQMRKRYDLNGFGNLDHIEPAALKPALKNSFTTSTLTPVDNTPHALGKVLDICDNNVALPTKSNGKDLSPLSPLPLPLPLPPSETVIYRNNVTQPQSDRRSTHARDRRSYIESGATQNGNQADAPAFSISVKALGRKSANGEEPLPLSPENEELVSELIKDGKQPICCQCNNVIEKGPFITALGRIWCPEHFICVNANCRRPLQDIGFVEEKGDLYCEYCFEKYLAPSCSKCNSKIKGDCLNAIGRHFHPECFTCAHCGKIFGNTPFFLEDGNPYCEADWNELFTTKCFACGFPVEAGDRWVEALNHNYHSQCFNCTYCKQNLEGQSFYNKGGRPFCKNHAR